VSDHADSLADALRDVRARLSRLRTEPRHAAQLRRLEREVDAVIARVEGANAPKDLLSIVCHDLKDPLASIVMGAGFLKKSNAVEGAGPTRRVVEAIARSADRMTTVITDFHDLAKLESGTLAIDPMAHDVVAVVRAACAPLEASAREHGVALAVESEREALLAKCDRTRAMQVVQKLVGNAVKFTASGGSVAVRVEVVESFARVSVRDTGRGIAPERLATIFDREANARQTPREGPGLGLAIVRALVELHGGRVTAESVPGVGSSFVFTLPRA
jgi:signal transduction histidine kinase